MLENRIALVTGASRGIGHAIAEQLARDGAKLIGTSTSEEGAKKVPGIGMVLDVRDPTQIEFVVNEIQKQHGDIAILVNNAGITRDNLALRMKDEDFDDVIATNLRAVFRLSRAVMRGMMKARWGRIINITSVVGASGNPGQANYAAAKAGIASLTIVMARELERTGVRVNAICPVARTRLTETVAGAGSFMEAKEGEFDRFAPENISAVVAWLASDLSDGVTGQVVKVMGGHVQLLRGWRPITESTADTPWTIDMIDAESKALFAQSDKGVPPFMPNIGDA